MTAAHLCEQLAQCCYLKVQCVRACVRACVCVCGYDLSSHVDSVPGGHFRSTKPKSIYREVQISVSVSISALSNAIVRNSSSI